MTAPSASNTPVMNVFTASPKPMAGERPKVFGEYDAALVDALMRWLRSRLSQIGLLCAK